MTAVRSGQSGSRGALLHAILATRGGRVGFLGVLLLILVALFGPLFAGIDPLTMTHTDQFVAPSWSYLMGSDEFGRDILSRVVYGLRLSFAVGGGAVAVGCAVGVSTGMLAGYAGGRIERWIMRIWDAALAFPAIIIGIATAVVLGPGTSNAIVAVAIVNMPQFARVARAGTIAEKSREYVEAAHSIGASTPRIVRYAIWPNIAGIILVQATVAAPRAIILEATLGFLGLGQQAPMPSLGGMVSTSRQFMTHAWWYALFPGLTVSVLVLCFTLLASRMSDVIDPRRRWRA